MINLLSEIAKISLNGWLEFVVVLCGILGQWFIMRRNAFGFVLWIIGNSFGVWWWWRIEAYWMLLFYLYLTVTSAYGIYEWGKHKPLPSSSTPGKGGDD